MELELILTSVLAPALVAAVGGALVWRPWRAVSPTPSGAESIGRGTLIALAVALGYLVGHVWTSGWPSVLPKSASPWLVHCALIGVVASLAIEPRGTATRWAGRLLCSTGITWLVFGKHLGRQPSVDVALWFSAVTTSILLMWTASLSLVERLPGRPLVSVLGILIATMGAVFMNCHDAQAAQLAGSIGGALGGLSVLVCIWPDRCSLRGIAPLLGLLLAPMLAIQHTDLFGSVPRMASAAMVLALPVGVSSLSVLGIPDRRSGWWVCLPVSMLCAAAVYFSWPAEDPYGY